MPTSVFNAVAVKATYAELQKLYKDDTKTSSTMVAIDNETDAAGESKDADLFNLEEHVEDILMKVDPKDILTTETREKATAFLDKKVVLMHKASLC
jgi:hypothetical protein